jgi:hypothetical protein
VGLALFHTWQFNKCHAGMEVACTGQAFRHVPVDPAANVHLTDIPKEGQRLEIAAALYANCLFQHRGHYKLLTG